jgi:hypothetical protein
VGLEVVCTGVGVGVGVGVLGGGVSVGVGDGADVLGFGAVVGPVPDVVPGPGLDDFAVAAPFRCRRS